MNESRFLTELNYLAHVINAIVVVECTVFSAETQSALTTVVIATVDTSSAIFARIKFLSAELDLLFTVSSCVSALAIATVRFHLIDAGGVVNALVIQTIIDVSFTAISLVAS